MEARDIRFGVVGAVGLQAYGLARATSDLDFVVEADAQQEVCSHLESLGYETLHRSAGYSNHVHALPALGRLDFVYVDDAADAFYQHAQRFRDAFQTAVRTGLGVVEEGDGAAGRLPLEWHVPEPVAPDVPPVPGGSGPVSVAYSSRPSGGTRASPTAASSLPTPSGPAKR